MVKVIHGIKILRYYIKYHTKKIKEKKFGGENFLKNLKKIFSEISKFWLKKHFFQQLFLLTSTGRHE